MLSCDYQFVLELFREDRNSVGRALISPDWEPAVECAEFEAMRLGKLPSVFGVADCVVEPLWHQEAGEPLVTSFSLSFTSDDKTSNHSKRFGTSYFQNAAATAGAKFKEAGVVGKEEQLSFQMLAFPQQPGGQKSNSPVFETEDLAQSLVLTRSSLTTSRAVARPTGESPEKLYPTFVPASLLEEIAELSNRAGNKETGGILIGHLHVDENGTEIFAVITTQLPAQHTEAELMKLTFTSETWTDVRNALQLRRQDEIMLGWWHSHPARAWCKECPEESQRQCAYARGFLSAHDRGLHRTIFPRAYSLALVVNDVAFAPPSFSLFGWQDGDIVERDFYVTGETGEFPLPSETPMRIQDKTCR